MEATEPVGLAMALAVQIPAADPKAFTALLQHCWVLDVWKGLSAATAEDTHRTELYHQNAQRRA